MTELKKIRGITLVEILIVISILAFLAAAASVPFSSFRAAQALNSSAADLVSLLKDARSAAVSSKDSSQYGVHFETARAVYFKGSVWSEPSSTNREISLDSTVSASLISLAGGGSDVIFEQLTGETSQYGTIEVSLKSNPSKKKTITILRTGVVSHN